MGFFGKMVGKVKNFGGRGLKYLDKGVSLLKKGLDTMERNVGKIKKIPYVGKPAYNIAKKIYEHEFAIPIVGNVSAKDIYRTSRDVLDTYDVISSNLKNYIDSKEDVKVDLKKGDVTRSNREIEAIKNDIRRIDDARNQYKGPKIVYEETPTQ
jgi:hypothetical protein